jgi:invasion protein IalB
VIWQTQNEIQEARDTMFANAIRLAGLALILASAPGHAQETTANDTSAQEQTQTEENAEVQAEQPTDNSDPLAPQQPQEEVRSVHNDWQIRCRSENDCFMYQLVNDPRGAPVAEINIVALPDDIPAVAGFTVVSPLRTLLTEGLTLQVDNGRVQQYPFLYCAPVGCASRFGYEQSGLNQFKRGNVARLTIVAVDRPAQPVILDVSLSGFTAAFNALSGS